MSYKFLLSVAAAAILFAGISSCEDNATDVEKPTFTVAEPLANDTISLAQSGEIHIEFTAVDNDELHEITVNVTNESGTNLYTKTVDADVETYNFHEHFTPTGITTVTPLTLKIDVSDHSANVSSQTVAFYVKP